MSNSGWIAVFYATSNQKQLLLLFRRLHNFKASGSVQDTGKKWDSVKRSPHLSWLIFTILVYEYWLLWGYASFQLVGKKGSPRDISQYP